MRMSATAVVGAGAALTIVFAMLVGRADAAMFVVITGAVLAVTTAFVLMGAGLGSAGFTVAVSSRGFSSGLFADSIGVIFVPGGKLNTESGSDVVLIFGETRKASAWAAGGCFGSGFFSATTGGSTLRPGNEARPMLPSPK